MSDQGVRTVQRGERATVAFSQFEEMMKQLGQSPSEIAFQCGYSPGSISTWRGTGAVPKWAHVALECLLHRRGPSNVMKASKMPAVLIVEVGDVDDLAYAQLTFERLKSCKILSQIGGPK